MEIIESIKNKCSQKRQKCKVQDNKLRRKDKINVYSCQEKEDVKNNLQTPKSSNYKKNQISSKNFNTERITYRRYQMCFAVMNDVFQK